MATHHPVTRCRTPETFNSRFCDECLNETLFGPLPPARPIIEVWPIDYNNDRPHSALADLTPMEFAARSTMDHNQKQTLLVSEGRVGSDPGRLS